MSDRLAYVSRGPGPWLRCGLRAGVLQGVAWLAGAASALAQGPSPPGGGGQTQIIRQGPSFAGGIILVIVMCGAALFAVCRSSRRN
jgi:hypothetical protein